MWEHFHHQADIGIRGIGDSLEQAFEGYRLIFVVEDRLDPVYERLLNLDAGYPDHRVMKVTYRYFDCRLIKENCYEE